MVFTRTITQTAPRPSEVQTIAHWNMSILRLPNKLTKCWELLQIPQLLCPLNCIWKRSLCSWLSWTSWQNKRNKLAKARKMRKPPGTLSLKKFGLGNLWVEKVWTQNTCILAIHFRKIYLQNTHTHAHTLFWWNNSLTSKMTVAQKCSAAMAIQKCYLPTDRQTWIGVRDTFASKKALNV